MPAIQEIYDKTIEGYTVDNDWLYYMDKDETTKHYIPYVYREISIEFYNDFKALMAKTNLYSQITWNDNRCAFTIFDTTFILACIESMSISLRAYSNRNDYRSSSLCITPIIFQDYQEHYQYYLNQDNTNSINNKNNITNNQYSYMEILSAGLINRFYNNNQCSASKGLTVNVSGVISKNNYIYDGYQLHTKQASSIRNETDNSKKNFKYGIVIHYNTNFLHIAYKPSYQFNLNGMSYYLNDKMPLIFICKGTNKLTNESVLYITADSNSSIKYYASNDNDFYSNALFGSGNNQNLLLPIYNHFGIYRNSAPSYTENGIVYSFCGYYSYSNGVTKYSNKISSSENLSVIHNLYNPKTKKHLDPYNVNPYFVFDLLPCHEKFISGFINKEASQIYLQKLQTYFGWIEFDNIFNVQESQDLYYQDAYYTINGETYYKSSNNFIGLQKHQNLTPIFLLKI